MKGYVIAARDGMEKHIVEDVLHDYSVRYEVWRTMEFHEGRYFHYWASPIRHLQINLELIKRSFRLFQAERRKQRVAAL